MCSFRRLAPTGLITLPKFRESLGLLGLFGKLLAESLFYAFDYDNDGYLNVVDFTRAVLIMLIGSDKRRLELSFRILQTPSRQEAGTISLKEGDAPDEPPGIDLKSFTRIVNDIRTTRNVLTGQSVPNPTPEHVDNVFKKNSSLCIDGVARITQHDFERAVHCSKEFVELMGAPCSVYAVEASLVAGNAPVEVSPACRPFTKCGSEDFNIRRQRTYINRTTKHRRRHHDSDTDESLPLKAQGITRPWLSPRRGLAVYFGHERWNDVINVMVGLGLTARKENGDVTRELEPADFTDKLTLSILPDTISGLMPSLKFVEHDDGHQFQLDDDPNKIIFTEHAPLVFKRLRKLMNLSEDAYIQSVGPEHLVGNMMLGNLSTLSELLSEGNSGALFYFTANGRLVLKTVTRQTAEFVQRWLPSYYNHTRENPQTLITRLAGLFSITQCKKGGSTTYFIIMNNVFYSSVAIHRRYDLKGSWVGRSVPLHERKDHTVALKDLDMVELEEFMELSEDRSRALFDTLQRDVDFLSKSMLMDYSLLLGIHYRSISEDDVNWQQDPDPRQMSCFMGKNRDRLYFVGLIDVLTEWDVRKRLEYAWRRLRTFNNPGVSCTPPERYAERFISFMKRRVA
ncbi:hypothetical protein BOVATA_023570 [Babesia ovata]|uniref:PIPK domain-containing protein n=1 Tax=Babesia ovata TaxID=189622 RepID=A0A2H6KD10_9APIC|nr:uncharacterized protein BOVATA_023570 [Babesia ovata]GBE60864.1 hypothetical protein BOVATA_023570 [Babesia ovata]